MNSNPLICNLVMFMKSMCMQSIQVILAVAEPLVHKVRCSMCDTISSLSMMWFPGWRISVVFESRKLVVLAAKVDKVRQDSPLGHWLTGERVMYMIWLLTTAWVKIASNRNLKIGLWCIRFIVHYQYASSKADQSSNWPTKDNGVVKTLDNYSYFLIPLLFADDCYKFEAITESSNKR